MADMSIDELHRILLEAAGGDGAGSGADIIDESFEVLGYDSLALIETAGAIKREYGVVIPDDEVTELRTPRELLDLVNSGLVARV